MKKTHSYFVVSFLVVGMLFATTPYFSKNEYTTIDKVVLDSIQAKDAFNTMMKVISHDRCVNCHPSDNRPKQGDQGNQHHFDIARGGANTGFEATKCTTCHQSENNVYSGVPGAANWSLAPKTMAWQGLTNKEIAKAMLDRTKNGNRSHKDLIHHLTEDKLVLWAFNPGVNQDGVQRTKPTVSEEEYKAAVKEWFEKGAIIPEDK